MSLHACGGRSAAAQAGCLDGRVPPCVRGAEWDVPADPDDPDCPSMRAGGGARLTGASSKEASVPPCVRGRSDLKSLTEEQPDCPSMRAGAEQQPARHPSRWKPGDPQAVASTTNCCQNKNSLGRTRIPWNCSRAIAVRRRLQPGFGKGLPRQRCLHGLFPLPGGDCLSILTNELFGVILD